MADQATKDAAAKARVISHMNADHQRELSHYVSSGLLCPPFSRADLFTKLRHYAKLSASAARSPKLDDISLSSMTISTPASGTHTIPITPPMSSYADARLRAVSMDETARSALGISSVQIKSFVPLTTSNICVLVVCLFASTSLAAQAAGYVAPGSKVWRALDAVVPGGAERYVALQRLVVVPMLAIHVGEAAWMSRKVEKHGVERWSGLWWKWVADNFLEGFGALARFDKEVKRLTKEKEAKTH